jgi:D-amino-acid dehydrogenase
VVGPAPKHRNLWIATGHGHLGLTDSLGTALRIADGVLGPVRTSHPAAAREAVAV